MDQLGKHLTLNFGLGHDLRVVRWSLVLGSTLDMECPQDIHSPSPSVSPLSPPFLNKQTNKQTNNIFTLSYVFLCSVLYLLLTLQ